MNLFAITQNYLAPVKLSVALGQLYSRTRNIFVVVYQADTKGQLIEEFKVYQLANVVNLSGFHKTFLPENTDSQNLDFDISSEDRDAHVRVAGKYFNLIITFPENLGFENSYDTEYSGPISYLDQIREVNLFEFAILMGPKMIWSYDPYEGANFLVFNFQNTEQIDFWAKIRGLDKQEIINKNGERALKGYGKIKNDYMFNIDDNEYSHFILFGLLVKDLLQTSMPFYHQSYLFLAGTAFSSFGNVVLIEQIDNRNIYILTNTEGKKVGIIMDYFEPFDRFVWFIKDYLNVSLLKQTNYSIITENNQEIINPRKRKLN